MKALDEYQIYRQWSHDHNLPIRSYNVFCHLRQYFSESIITTPSEPEQTDAEGIDLWNIAEGILDKCRCEKIYTNRKMVDPNCAWCEFHVDFMQAMTTYADLKVAEAVKALVGIGVDKDRESNTIATASCYIDYYNQHSHSDHVEANEAICKLMVSYCNSRLFDKWNKHDDDLTEAVKAKDAEIEIMIEADRQRCIVYDEMVSELSEANKRIAHETNKVKALCAELDRKVRIVLPSDKIMKGDNIEKEYSWGYNDCLAEIKSLNEGAEFIESK